MCKSAVKETFAMVPKISQFYVCDSIQSSPLFNNTSHSNMLSRARGCRTLSLHLPHTICVPRATFTSIGDQPLIHKLDLRVGRIVKVEPHPQAEHLYVEQVDLGEKSEENVEQTRTIVSGLVKYVSMRDMLASINVTHTVA